MQASTSALRPLCVDLDGTLVKTDLLYESVLELVRCSPWILFILPFWLLRGKAYLKAEVASRVDFTARSLPVNADVASYIQAQRGMRKTYLVSGSHYSLVQAVAANVALFDGAKGSDHQTNLTGHRKRDWLISEFGEAGFDYIGNDLDDIKVWSAAKESLAVSTPDGIATTAGIEFSHVFDMPTPGLRDYLKLMRVHQWLKNLLILVPFFLAQRLGDPEAALSIVLAFFAMSLLASATYITNDMLDLQSDRENLNKSNRPLASGQISIAAGLQLATVLLVAVVIISLALPLAFNIMLGVYLASTLCYSFFLKRKAIIDVITLASLHTLRVIAGTVAIQAQWSFWLLAFSMFIFFSLAMAKRVAELKNLMKSGRTDTIGRDYHVDDIPVLLSMGVSSGTAAVLVIALYINGEKVQRLYESPFYLWLICPIMMYWITYVWIKTSRGLMNEDPLVFAVSNRTSQGLAICAFLAVVCAMML